MLWWNEAGEQGDLLIYIGLLHALRCLVRSIKLMYLYVHACVCLLIYTLAYIGVGNIFLLIGPNSSGNSGGIDDLSAHSCRELLSSSLQPGCFCLYSGMTKSQLSSSACLHFPLCAVTKPSVL